jgi:hypothetical protein
MALTIEQITASLRITRDEFGRIFQRSQVDVMQNPADRALFEAVGTSGVDQEAFVQGLTFAQQNGFLDAIVRAVVIEGLEDGRITASLAAEAADATPNAERKAALQAITNVSRGFQRPEVLFHGVNVGMRWTVRILIDGTFSGTGILIGPHLVLSAWHVVRALFDPAGTNKFKPKDNVAGRLAVEFDDLSGLFDMHGPPMTPQRVAAHVRWCATYSECHPAELAGNLPSDPAELEGFWDYAVLRLAKTPGLERRWAALDARAAVPAPNGPIVVFQYPAGQPMRLDEGAIVAPEAAFLTAVPRFRFLHGANAVGGSSGGPCFDRAFMLFGLHQGEWTRPGGNGPRVNRGVPIIGIKEDIQQKLQDLPVPDPSECPVWKLSKADLEAPVVGCDPYQGLIWASAVTGKPKLILIGGEQKSGKTFRISVLSAMLPDSGHLKVAIRADVISKMSALELAVEICKKAGAAVPAFVSAAEFNSTVNTWLRDEVVEKVIQALDAVRLQRLVWITIAELNKSDIQGEDASPFLLLLYERTKSSDWLRIVLDGMKGDPPEAVRKLTEWHRTAELTLDDIETYLRRAIAEYQTPNNDAVVPFSIFEFGRYTQRLNQIQNRLTALQSLAADLEDYVGPFIE